MMKDKLNRLIVLITPFIIVGCSGATGNVSADSPIERGLSYIAAAIVTHGVLQIFFRE